MLHASVHDAPTARRHRFARKRMKRVVDCLFTRQNPGAMSLSRPARAKSHLAAALGLALVEKGWRVLFTRTTDLVQKLQLARRDLGLEAAIAKLDKYHLLILDDLAYLAKDQAETSVLFDLISARYERRSLLITANQRLRRMGQDLRRAELVMMPSSSSGSCVEQGFSAPRYDFPRRRFAMACPSSIAGPSGGRVEAI